MLAFHRRKAIVLSDESAVKNLLNQGVDINTEYKDGKTPLIIAIERNMIKSVEFLVKNGADVHKVSKNGNTPLSTAKIGKSDDIVLYLLKQGARK